MMTKPDYVTVSFSGGKDSTAMLLRMIEMGEHIDEVITADTGMEFPAMYRHIDKVAEIIKAHGIKYTTLRNDKSFQYYLLGRPVASKKWGEHTGYGWASMKSRWCTKHLKTELVDNHLHELRDQYRVIQCIGLASDETKRLDRVSNKQSNHRHPLVEWGWTEKDCLQYCYDSGYDWEGLYELFNRVSCWCCPLQGVSELRKLYHNFPSLWSELIDMDESVKKTGNKYVFMGTASVLDLTKRFIEEDRRKAIGVNVTSRNFFNSIKQKIPENQTTLANWGD